MKVQYTNIKTETIAIVRRPNGEVERVNVTGKVTASNTALIKRMAEATKNAGRGDFLEVVDENVTEIKIMEVPDNAVQISECEYVVGLENSNFMWYSLGLECVIERDELARKIRKNDELYRKLLPTEFAMSM